MTKARMERIVEFLGGQRTGDGGPAEVPDVFAIYEVVGKHVFGQFMESFPDHRFFLTEGEQSQEIFIGVRSNLLAFTTVRLEFKTQRAYQRPGVLLTVRIAGEDYSLLFLHLKSGANPEDFGLRDAAFGSAFSLGKAIDKATGGAGNFVFCGDLNTMGIDDPAPYSKVVDLTAEQEIARLAAWATRRDMKLLPKDAPHSWWNGSSGYVRSALDHVVAADHMDVKGSGGAAEVTAFGWPRVDEAHVDRWLVDYSDHALLWFEVWE